MSEHSPPAGDKPSKHDSNPTRPGDHHPAAGGRPESELGRWVGSADDGSAIDAGDDSAATHAAGDVSVSDAAGDATLMDASGGATSFDAGAPGSTDSSGAPGALRVAWPGLASVLAVALALLATTIAGFLWWQYRQFYVALHTADTEMEASLERVRANDRSTADQVADLSAAIEASREREDLLAASLQDLPRRLTDLERNLDELPDRLSAMERQINAVQGGSSDARAAWIRAEAEYYLMVANTELDLGGRWENAVTALELADNRLRALSNPALGSVREQIADELLALASIELPDIEGLVFGLSRLADRVDELPLRLAAPANYEQDGPSLDEAEPGLGRLWLGIQSALRGIVSVERSEEPPAQGLSAERRSLARRELATELQLARVAALREQPEAFDASLRAATALLERNFDTSAGAVEGAIGLLRELLEVDIAPQRPDISGSLSLLRSLPAGSD